MLSTMGLDRACQTSTSIANADPAARFRDKMVTLGPALTLPWAGRRRRPLPGQACRADHGEADPQSIKNAGRWKTPGARLPFQKIPVGPSYQVPLARAVKRTTRMPVIAVGFITEFEQAEAIAGTGDADLIALARTILYNPRLPWHAAAHFGAHVKAPDQYLRSQPRQYPDLFDIGH